MAAKNKTLLEIEIVANENETSKITSQWIKITPKLATDWLQRNKHNRALNMNKVDQYAEDMRNGNWDNTGDPIRFNWNDDLMDGQHRLMAVIKSGVTSIRFLVLHGLNPEAFRSIDTGATRSAGDVLRINGYRNTSHLASTVRWLLRYQPVLEGKNLHKDSIQNHKVLEYVQKNPSIAEFVSTCVGVIKCKHIHPAHVASIGFQAALQLTSVPDPFQHVLSFFMPVVTAEGLVRYTPQHTLYKRLIEAQNSKRSGMMTINRDTISALIVKAYNAWFNNEPLKMLKYHDTESFPAIEPVNRKRSKSA